MRNRWIPMGLLVLALAGGWTTGRAVAEAGQDALLTRQKGPVEACREGSTTWTTVITSRYLATGDSGRTLGGGRAQIRLQYGNVVLAVGPTTRFTVTELNREFGRARVSMGWGSIRTRIEGASAGQPDRYQVITPNAVLGAQGTEWTTHYVALDGSTPMGQDALPQGWPETPPLHTRAAVHKGFVRVVSVQTGDVKVLEPRSTVDIGPDGLILVNPPDFPYPADRATGAGIEKGTTGEGEFRGDGGEATQNPSQPGVHPTTTHGSDSYTPPSPPPPSPPPPPPPSP